jgi:hypothetical protein
MRLRALVRCGSRFLCVSVRVGVCVRVRAPTHTRRHARTRTHALAHALTHTYTHTHTHLHTFTHIHTDQSTQAHSHAPTHTNPHAPSRALRPGWASQGLRQQLHQRDVAGVALRTDRAEGDVRAHSLARSLAHAHTCACVRCVHPHMHNARSRTYTHALKSARTVARALRPGWAAQDRVRQRHQRDVAGVALCTDCAEIPVRPPRAMPMQRIRPSAARALRICYGCMRVRADCVFVCVVCVCVCVCV